MTVPYRPPGIPDSVWYQMYQNYTPPPTPTPGENYMNQYFPQQPQYSYRPPAQTGAPSWFQSVINRARAAYAQPWNNPPPLQAAQQRQAQIRAIAARQVARYGFPGSGPVPSAAGNIAYYEEKNRVPLLYNNSMVAPTFVGPTYQSPFTIPPGGTSPVYQPLPASTYFPQYQSGYQAPPASGYPIPNPYVPPSPASAAVPSGQGTPYWVQAMYGQGYNYVPVPEAEQPAEQPYGDYGGYGGYGGYSYPTYTGGGWKAPKTPAPGVDRWLYGIVNWRVTGL